MQIPIKKIVALAADHTGFELKNKMADVLEGLGFQVQDYGTFGAEPVSADDFATAVSNAIIDTRAGLGLLISATGNDMAIAANRYVNIKAALSWNIETANWARTHLNANVLCLPAHFMHVDEAVEILTCFFTTPFDEEEPSSLPPDDENW